MPGGPSRESQQDIGRLLHLPYDTAGDLHVGVHDQVDGEWAASGVGDLPALPYGGFPEDVLVADGRAVVLLDGLLHSLQAVEDAGCRSDAASTGGMQLADDVAKRVGLGHRCSQTADQELLLQQGGEHGPRARGVGTRKVFLQRGDEGRERDRVRSVLLDGAYGAGAPDRRAARSPVLDVQAAAAVHGQTVEDDAQVVQQIGDGFKAGDDVVQPFGVRADHRAVGVPPLRPRRCSDRGGSNSGEEAKRCRAPGGA